MAKENREVKNSVLIDLFCEDETAQKNDISLYNALHEVPLTEETVIEKIRVENVLYMNFRNDISFGVQGKVIVFGEHQSTLNENMPLRSVMYLGRAYEQIVPTRDRYKRGLVRVPQPEFYSFYNGTAPMEKEQILKLSDAYEEYDKTVPSAELTVRIININPAAGHEILERCPIMKEYSFVYRYDSALSGTRGKGCLCACNSCVYQKRDSHKLSGEKGKRGGKYVDSGI